jgi:hypothetical protein
MTRFPLLDVASAALALVSLPLEASAEPLASGGPVVGAHLGASFGQPFGDLGTGFAGQLEFGWVLDLPAPIDRDFQLVLAGQYAGPSASGDGAEPDPRLPGGSALSYDLTERQAIVDLGVLYRLPFGATIRPTAGLGARMFLTRTELTARAGGSTIPAREETATHFGLFASGGAEWSLGPGAISAQVQLGYGGETGGTIRNANLGSLAVLAGYRHFL